MYNAFNVVQVKAFGTLVKGLRFGMDLLKLLQNEGYIIEPLSKVFTVPILSGNDGLDQYLSQFEAAVDSDFPNYQVLPPNARILLYRSHIKLAAYLLFVLVLPFFQTALSLN